MSPQPQAPYYDPSTDPSYPQKPPYHRPEETPVTDRTESTPLTAAESLRNLATIVELAPEDVTLWVQVLSNESATLHLVTEGLDEEAAYALIGTVVERYAEHWGQPEENVREMPQGETDPWVLIDFPERVGGWTLSIMTRRPATVTA